MIDVKGELVVAKPEPQPKVGIEIQVNVQAYRQFGLTCKLGKQFTSQRGQLLTPPKVTMVTDTGAQVDCIIKE